MGDNIVNFYAGQPPLNRLSFQRQSADKLNEHLQADNARFVLFRDLHPLVKEGEPGKLHFLSRTEVEALIQSPFAAPSTEDASNRDRSRLFEAARLPFDLPSLVFLGIDDRPTASSDSVPMAQDPLNPRGVPYWAVDASSLASPPVGSEFGDARGSGGAMQAWEAGIFAQARALVDWNVRNKFCAACGSRTYSLWGGWKRSCTSALDPAGKGEKEPCFSLKGLHNFAYPRTDTVVIMGILSADGDKILLGRQKSWPKGMYSCLAGFIEPGESFEDAVRREVLEEAGIQVGPVRYQPWPYPANIMVGCFGRAAEQGQQIRLDLDNELEDAQWFSRAQLAQLVGSPTGSHLSKADLKLLDRASSGQAQVQTAAGDSQVTANALAPSERKDGEGEVAGQSKADEELTGTARLTRVPPQTAIAGMLIRTWVQGELELVSRL